MLKCFQLICLTGEHRTEIVFFLAQTDAAATGDHDGLIVQGIVDVLQSGVDLRGRLIDLGRTWHVESFVRTLVVEDINKIYQSGPAVAESWRPQAWWLLFSR